jgi:hypothetical protein
MDSLASIQKELLDQVLSGDQYEPKIQRLEDILNSYLESDRIYNRERVSPKFIRALIDVLRRMPEGDYYEIPDNLIFIVETKHILAQNIKLNAYQEVKGVCIHESYYVVAIYCTALGYPHNALVGLIAHEIAHSFVDKPDDKSNEDATDALVARWGFQAELQALQKHKEELESSPLRSE